MRKLMMVVASVMLASVVWAQAGPVAGPVQGRGVAPGLQAGPPWQSDALAMQREALRLECQRLVDLETAANPNPQAIAAQRARVDALRAEMQTSTWAERDAWRESRPGMGQGYGRGQGWGMGANRNNQACPFGGPGYGMGQGQGMGRGRGAGMGWGQGMGPGYGMGRGAGWGQGMGRGARWDRTY